MVETRTLPIGPEELTRYPAARAPIIGVLMAYINTKKRSNLALTVEETFKTRRYQCHPTLHLWVPGVGISVHGQKRWLNIVMAPLPPFSHLVFHSQAGLYTSPYRKPMQQCCSDRHICRMGYRTPCHITQSVRVSACQDKSSCPHSAQSTSQCLSKTGLGTHE